LKKMFFAQEGVFEAVRDAAMALKAMGRWDLVLDRCIRYFKMAVDAEVVRMTDARPEDDYPFRWLFPTNGFPVEKQPMVRKIRTALFRDFRNILAPTEKFWSDGNVLARQIKQRLPLPPPPPVTKTTTSVARPLPAKRPRETAVSDDGTKLAEKVLVNLSRDRIKIRKVSAAEEKTKN
jgi:hypothetical protein